MTKRRAWTLTAVLMPAAVAATMRRVEFGRFCPENLEYQSRTEFAILGGELPFYYTSWHTVPSHPVISFLQAEGFVEPTETEAVHWEEFWPRSPGQSGQGNTLRVAFSPSYIEWSEKDRERAKLFWTTLFARLRSPMESDRAFARAFAARAWATDDIVELRCLIDHLDKIFNTPAAA